MTGSSQEPGQVTKDEEFQGNGKNRLAASRWFVKSADEKKAPAEARGF
jgi:hypothetical protein